MKEEIYIFFIGTAGSGKSTLTSNFYDWIKLRGLDAIIVNLDPGAENLPYEPNVDIRDWISLEEVMETYQLGPNGAQIACADMIALNIQDIKSSIESFKSDYIIIDTPGQLELFVFREAGKYTVNFLNPDKSIICYLLDPSLAKTPSGFVAQILLSITANFRLNQPQINILSKSDLLSKEDMGIIKRWANNPDDLYGAIINEEASIHRDLHEGILQIVKNFGGSSNIVPTSKKELFGMDDIYTNIQILFKGGEDLLKD
jgi:GTPase SAR1 family protein